MKKIITDAKSLAALLMAGAALAACSGDDNIVEEQPANPTQHTYTMTIEASKGGGSDATTRALSIDGSGALNATWETSNEVKAYNYTKSSALTGSLKPQSNGVSATLTGSLTGSVAKDDVVYLRWPSVDADYTGQDGKLETIAQRYDYTTGIAKVTSVDGTAIVAEDYPNGGPVTFINSQAIVKFTLIDKATSSPINATQLTIDAKDSQGSSLIQSLTFPDTYTLGTITINRTTPTDNVVYAALPFSGQAHFTFNLAATDGTHNYTYEKADVTMLNGRYYEVKVRMNDAQPLTFEAREAGASVTFKVNTDVATNGVEYSTDGSSWAAYTPYTPITLENVGDRVMFRGNNAAYATASDNGDNCEFSCTKPCYIYGNIMSLITSTGFEKATTLTEPYTFKYLFDYNSNIDIHPIQKLLLPATTLTEKCYYCMFRSCYGLTKAPELPAMTMAKACYSKMFHNCTALEEAPYLPAMTLADDCYSEMFAICSSLKTPPAILPATTLAGSCYNKMFSHCTNLERAPYLPATQLIGACYYMMFYDCKKINSITCLATNFYGDCTYYWLYGVASDGTFTKASSATWTSGYSGIPDGWSVKETTHL